MDSCVVGDTLGPHTVHTSDIITLCPDQDYMVVLECTVTDNSGLAWIGEIFNGTIQYSSSAELGQIEQECTTLRR